MAFRLIVLEIDYNIICLQSYDLSSTDDTFQHSRMLIRHFYLYVFELDLFQQIL